MDRIRVMTVGESKHFVHNGKSKKILFYNNAIYIIVIIS